MARKIRDSLAGYQMSAEDDDDFGGLSLPSVVHPYAVKRHGMTRITWDENGMPVLEDVPPRTEDGMKKITHTLLSSPYQGHIDEETGEVLFFEGLAGMTHAEALQRILIGKAINGSIKSTEILFDRAYGKPKQQTENVNLNMSYEDFLDRLAAKTNNESPPGPLTVDIQPESIIDDLL